MGLGISIISLPKLGLVPLEGDMKGIPIMTMYNPESLSFTKEMNLADKDGENQTAGSDIPENIKYTGGKPIDLNVKFYFDYFEEKKDVRPIVMAIVHLAEKQDCDKDDNQTNAPKRAPRVAFVWKDANPLGSGPYFACITSVTVNYIMFLDDGTPCRAEVDIKCTQVNPLAEFEKLSKITSKVITTAGLTAAAIETFKGGRAAIEAAGGKIEDPSTWPISISIQF